MTETPASETPIARADEPTGQQVNPSVTCLAEEDRIEAMQGFLRDEFAPMLRKAMYLVSAIAAATGVAAAFCCLVLLASLR